ncbi:cytidylyltransferase domain-containing protein [Flavobacterium pedocola]
MGKTAFFIQARVGSTRLPGKVLLPFYGNSSILDLVTENIKSAFPDISLVLCTSTSSADDLIVDFCKKNGIDCFRGSENNVLSRFTEAADFYGVSTVIRICADNPFLDVSFLKELLDFYAENPNADYWSFKNTAGTPVIKTHYGFFAEIVTNEALQAVLQRTDDPLYLEHVTNFVYAHDGFEVRLKELPDYLKDRTDLRFTIDDEDDFENLKPVYQFYKNNNQDLRKTVLFVDQNSSVRDKMIANIKKYSK